MTSSAVERRFTKPKSSDAAAQAFTQNEWGDPHLRGAVKENRLVHQPSSHQSLIEFDLS
jgi:hypothetical protein